MRKQLPILLTPVIFLSLFMALSLKENGKLPILSTLKPFVLRDHNAQRFTLDSFYGRVSVVDFIFTTCPGICPLLTQKMATLERNTREYGNRLQFISISVDPETDTPLVMKAFVQKQGLDMTRWKFVTGPLFEIEQVVIEGFRSPFAKRKLSSHPSLLEVSHSENFVLVDPEANLRVFLPARNEEDLKKILAAIQQLIQ